MGDELQPSKKRAAGRELSRDNPGLDDEEEVGEQEMGTFKKASEEVLATRRIVKPRRQTSTTPSAPTSNPFAGIRLVPPPAPAQAQSPAEAQAQVTEDKTGSEDADTKDDANSESETKKLESQEKVNESEVDPNVDKEKDGPTDAEQGPAVTNEERADKGADLGPDEERVADGSSEKVLGGDSTQVQVDDGEKNGNEKSDGSGNVGGAPFSSFQQLSNTQNAFSGLSGTGFSTSTFSFGPTKEGSSSQSSLPTFSFGGSNNGTSPLFGSVMTGTSIGTKTEGPTFRSMQEVQTETGEENEETIFSADAALYEFLDAGWRERGKGEVKVNVLKGEAKKARLVMRTKGNLRLILNASLYPDMNLTKMDKKGVTFACVNSATEGKDGLSTFALKFKDGSVFDDFFWAIDEHKGKPAISTLNTPENSPKAGGDSDLKS